MNCKPGDLALLKADGSLWHVIRMTPPADFLLPDGFTHIGAGSEHGDLWLCESLRFGGHSVPIEYRPGVRGTRVAKFASISDSHLIPIRDNPGADETLAWAPVPGVKWTIAPDKETT